MMRQCGHATISGKRVRASPSTIQIVVMTLDTISLFSPLQYLQNKLNINSTVATDYSTQ